MYDVDGTAVVISCSSKYCCCALFSSYLVRIQQYVDGREDRTCTYQVKRVINVPLCESVGAQQTIQKQNAVLLPAPLIRHQDEDCNVEVHTGTQRQLHDAAAATAANVGYRPMVCPHRSRSYLVPTTRTWDHVITARLTAKLQSKSPSKPSSRASSTAS